MSKSSNRQSQPQLDNNPNEGVLLDLARQMKDQGERIKASLPANIRRAMSVKPPGRPG